MEGHNLIKDLKKINGIVAYSLFQLPYDDDKRKKIYDKIIKNKKESGGGFKVKVLRALQNNTGMLFTLRNFKFSKADYSTFSVETNRLQFKNLINLCLPRTKINQITVR